MIPNSIIQPSPTRSLPLPEIATDFQLDDDIVFFNHGSYGACPRPVFAAYQQWQQELERNPVKFFGRRLNGLLAEARGTLAEFVGTQAENVVFVPNVTHAANFVAHSLALQPGDEVLLTDQEYGAVQGAWEYHCEKKGAKCIYQSIALPVSDPALVVDRFWAGVTERTKVIVMSHITSPTALILPIAQVCARARAAGIITFIDGAHAVGQLELNLDNLGADYYGGNCHKWLNGAKGSAFLYARPECQTILEPLVVSWGWKNRNAKTKPLLDYYSLLGTTDPASYLAVPAAIEYQLQHNWSEVRLACHALARELRAELLTLSGLPSICPNSPDWWMQMFSAPLPPNLPDNIGQRLWEDFQIEVPAGKSETGMRIRISMQVYNTPSHCERLLAALRALLV